MNSAHPDRDKLAAFVDGKLNEADAATIAEHLAGCDTCIEAIDRFPWVNRVQEQLRSPEPDPVAVDAPVRAWLEGMKRLPPRSAAPKKPNSGPAKPFSEPVSGSGEPGGVEGRQGQQPVVKETTSDRSVASTPPSVARSATPTEELPEQFGRYRILKQLGRGGMGSVYLAHDTQLDRQVALKVPHFTPEDGPEILERFNREARSAATLDHPNICPVYDVGEINGVHYISMAYIDGKPLSDLIPDPSPPAPLPQGASGGKQPPLPSGGEGRGEGGAAAQREGRGEAETSAARRQQFIPQRQVAAIVRKLALALEEAHARGVVHRDLKPSNIMVNKRRELVIMDFGLARLTKVAKPGEERLTSSGMILGTPAYMSPEQVTGDVKAIGPGCDIYSLGVMMFELLTGRLPFEGPLAAILGQIMVAEPPPLTEYRPDLDPQLAAICRKAMAKKIAERHASMAELASALADYLRTDRAQPEPKQPGRSKPGEKQHRPKPSLAGDDALAQFFEQIEAEKQAAPNRERTHGQTIRPQPRPTRWRRLVAASAAALAVLAGIVILVPTKYGTIKIVLDERATGVEVKVDGEVIDITGLGKPLKFEAGEHGLVVTGYNFETVTETFTIRRGKDEVHRVEFKPIRFAKPVVRPVPASLAKTVTNSINMQLVLIPAGEFWMGADADEAENRPDERPRHRGRITKPFYLGVDEVTQKEFEAVMHTNPSSFCSSGIHKDKVAALDTGSFPVEKVSWNTASDFCRRLSELPEEKKAGRAYRLPTEAEWEYACRAGSTTPFHFGTALSSREANVDGSAPYGDAAKGPTLGRPAPVGSYAPNAFGLHDMHGNVQEWCQDYMIIDYYQRSPPEDPTGPPTGDRHVMRGGSWKLAAGKFARAAARTHGPPIGYYDDVGFRVVCEVSSQPGMPAGEAASAIQSDAADYYARASQGVPQRLAFCSDKFKESGPSVSSDGLELFFAGDRPGGPTQFDLFVARRGSIAEPFGDPVPLRVASSGSHERVPFVTADGLTLYFQSNRAGGGGGWDLYAAKRTKALAEFDRAELLAEASTHDHEDNPAASADGCTLVFTRWSNDGKHEVLRGTRKAPNDPFVIEQTNVPGNAYPVAVGDHGSLLLTMTDSGAKDRGLATHYGTWTEGPADGYVQPMRILDIGNGRWNAEVTFTRDARVLFYNSDDDLYAMHVPEEARKKILRVLNWNPGDDPPLAADEPVGATEPKAKPTAVPAEDAAAAGNTSYAAIWEQLRPLLSERDYAAAGKMLEEKLNDPAHKKHREKIEADQADLERLKTIMQAVDERLSALKPGDKVRVRDAAGQTFVSYDAEKQKLVTKSGASAKEKVTRLSELHAADLAELAEPTLGKDNPQTKRTLGILFGFGGDKQGDIKRGRELLDEASKDDLDVARWLDRLGEPEPVAPAKKHADQSPKKVQKKPLEAPKSVRTPTKSSDFYAVGQPEVWRPVKDKDGNVIRGWGCTISHDGLEIGFNAVRPESRGKPSYNMGEVDLFLLRRRTIEAPFEDVRYLGETSTLEWETPYCLSPDGLRFYFGRAVGGPQAVMLATRAARQDSFSKAVPLGGMERVSMPTALLSPDELTMLYAPGAGKALLRATRRSKDEAFGAGEGTNLPEWDDQVGVGVSPLAMSNNGSVVFTRLVGDGMCLYVARCDGAADAYQQAERILELGGTIKLPNGKTRHERATMSYDASVLFAFRATREGPGDLNVLRIPDDARKKILAVLGRSPDARAELPPPADHYAQGEPGFWDKLRDNEGEIIKGVTPFLSSDALELHVSADPNKAFVARRPTRERPFGRPVEVPKDKKFEEAVSPDGRIKFYVSKSSGYQLLRAIRGGPGEEFPEGEVTNLPTASGRGALVMKGLAVANDGSLVFAWLTNDDRVWLAASRAGKTVLDYEAPLRLFEVQKCPPRKDRNNVSWVPLMATPRDAAFVIAQINGELSIMRLPDDVRRKILQIVDGEAK